MVNKSANTFDAAARSLRMTVTPALVGSESLAAEQVRVITGVLDFYRDRAHYEYPRKLYEFRTYRVLAEHLSCYDDEHGARARLVEVLEEAYATEQVAIPDYGLLDRVTDELTRAISDFVRSAHTSDSGVFAEVSRLVLEHSRPLVEMERSWFLPQGVDPDPDAVLPLSSLLGAPITTNSAH